MLVLASKSFIVFGLGKEKEPVGLRTILYAKKLVKVTKLFERKDSSVS